MEVFWITLSFGFLLAYGFGYLYVSSKLSTVAETESERSRNGLTPNRRVLRVSRIGMQRILGTVWFLDGLFQLKPQMFTPSFLKQVVLPTSAGQPHWLASIVKWGAGIEMSHIVVWNTLFALIQLLIGLALIFNFRVKFFIIASLIWSVFVWIFGEGAGQILTGQSSLINGAPGAALIYGLLGIAVFPKQEADAGEWRGFGIRFAQVSLAIVLFTGFALQFQHLYLTPTGLSQAVSVTWLAKAIGTGGIPLSILLALIELALGTMLLVKFKLRFTVWVSIALFFVYWWMGQSFGQFTQPLATDFNTGLLMILLAISSNPELASWYTEKTVQYSAI
ncbi:hypothetical protein [Alicyclobacillus sp. SO9]|uniref:hypothetical protein n=1 Tax=Alicyclobacillus sp. SO9 TaxID=2665646 RepID=UPI0018E7D105|nr:hypothetical protein [Alicyclobacillus sp. SO9]QQE80023.1 hypothetical protein GI364_06010 [Alicyclobacillus sp. SO9]